MPHILDTLQQRGFIAQTTFPEELREQLNAPTVYYCGFDPTADSLHVGHFIPIMAMAHLQRAGHRPIALVGGGTAMVGDPSGRNSMRNMMPAEEIQQNSESIKAQLARFLSFEGANAAIMVNNADWLLGLNYVDFLREVGAHFSVNRMLTADCYKNRMEQGLTFLEFNYMLMQSYDFLALHRLYGCALQVGGDDQWSNIISGADLIRRKEQGRAFALTFQLLLNSAGEKMGKTAAGALWMSAERTSPYEFFQYWRNVEDAVVERCLLLLTFLSFEEIKALVKEGGAALNHAKAVLAFEVTKLVHGEAHATAAREAAASLFGGGANDSDVPEVTISANDIANIVDAFVLAGLCASKGEARRLIAGGGAYLEGEKITQAEAVLDAGTYMLRKGKKDYRRVVIS
ncbi:MAG: tyrosine--tRNA ligase [Clostridia bacterium]|nr:tyrosine--tRNA ligase [Clostridia bacterium]